jgi:predicted deacylase
MVESWRMRIALVLVALASSGATAAQAPFTVGPLSVGPGEARSGFIDVPAARDSGTRIPITVMRGRAPGPVLALVAGTHGSEIAPVLALQRLRRQIDVAQLGGTLILVHVANLPSFLGRTIYYGPTDGKNLNRMYPGDAFGTVSQRIAFVITRDVIARADYLVDMHAGDGNESLRPYTYWSKLGLDARVDSLSREMALAWGNEYIVVDTNRPRDPAASIYTQNTAQTRGKPSITTEIGYLGVPAEDMIDRNVRCALRLMRFLRMLPGPVERVANPIWLERTEVLRSPVTGVWTARVERGATVTEGAVLGVLTDFFGEPAGEIRAPFAGLVLYIVATPAMNAGEPVAMIGQPLPAARGP